MEQAEQCVSTQDFPGMEENSIYFLEDRLGIYNFREERVIGRHVLLCEATSRDFEQELIHTIWKAKLATSYIMLPLLCRFTKFDYNH